MFTINELLVDEDGDLSIIGPAVLECASLALIEPVYNRQRYPRVLLDDNAVIRFTGVEV